MKTSFLICEYPCLFYFVIQWFIIYIWCLTYDPMGFIMFQIKPRKSPPSPLFYFFPLRVRDFFPWYLLLFLQLQTSNFYWLFFSYLLFPLSIWYFLIIICCPNLTTCALQWVELHKEERGRLLQGHRKEECPYKWEESKSLEPETGTSEKSLHLCIWHLLVLSMM